VAQLAGVPGPVLERAREILARLEAEHARLALRESEEGEPPQTAAPPGVTGVGPDERAALLGELSELPVEAMTPIDALNELARLRAKARAGGAR
jgi:DNA mismatch repair protein MutS